MEESNIVAVPADALMLVMTWQALWFCLVAFWLGIMGYFAGQWLGELGDWLSDHLDRRVGHRISAWLALRRARAASSINARETVYADWPGPRVASTGPHVNQRPDAGMAPAGGPAPGHTTRNGCKPANPLASRPEKQSSLSTPATYAGAAYCRAAPREGSLVGLRPIETEGLNPQGKSPARRDTPSFACSAGSALFTCAGGGAACSSCLPVGRCAADCPY